MQRYFVANEQMSETHVTLTGDDAAHIVRVMRMQAGDEIVCLNQAGRGVRAILAVLSIDTVEAEIVSELSLTVELPVHVTIAQGMPKGDKLELIVQKGTELGAREFLPFFAARTIVKWDAKKAEKKTARLAKIAKEAAEQSYRQFVPEVASPLSSQALLKKMATYDCVIVCDEEVAKSGEPKMLKQAFMSLERNQTVLVIVGPEGGLTREEVADFQAQGAYCCGLGPRILRTETAALYVLSALSYHLET
ncbi:16S rRNA (uracil(1498)-N(3))-methyltransferase [Bacillus sp. FSL W7-1360]